MGALAGLLDDDDDDDDLVVLLVRLDVASLAVLLDDVGLDGVLDDDAFDEDFTLDVEDSDVLEDEVLLVVGFDLDFSDPPVVFKFLSLSLIVSRPKALSQLKQNLDYEKWVWKSKVVFLP